MKESKESAREIAWGVLMETEQTGGYLKDTLETALRKHQFSAKEERAFVTRLAEGVTERKITLDRIIRLFSKVPFEKIRLPIRILLRMGIYQILYMDSVPDRAAVYETVRLMKNHHLQGLTGYVNAVLRAVAEDRGRKPEDSRIENLLQKDLSARYSVPAWLWKRLNGWYPAETADCILKDQFQERPTTIRVNRTRTTRDALQARLEEAGIRVEKGHFSEAALQISGYDFIRRIPGFREGLFTIQDESSMAAVESLGIREGSTVADVCGAPGGKTTYAAELTGRNGKVLSFDVSEEKVAKIRENAERLGLFQTVVSLRDARKPDPAGIGMADFVIVDVPCSGLGVISRKNDIKYHIREKDLNALAVLGTEILRNSASLLKPGGRILFSTCTLNPDENQGTRDRFLRSPEGKGFQVIRERQTLQGVDPCDGFYYCVMEKI